MVCAPLSLTLTLTLTLTTSRLGAMVCAPADSSRASECWSRSTKLAKQLVGSEGKDERARVGCCSDQGYGYGYG